MAANRFSWSSFSSRTLKSARRDHNRESRRGVLRRRAAEAMTCYYDRLEPRELLAFSGTVSGTTTTLTQTADDGNIAVFNNGVGNSWLVLDGAGLAQFAKTDNVEINLLPGSSVLQLYLEDPHSGDVHVNLNSGDREFRMDGLGNSIGGKLRIDGGTGNQTINLTGNAGLNVVGDVTIALGAGGMDAVVDNAFEWTIGGALRFFGVNSVSISMPVSVGGFLVFNTAAETSSSSVNLNGTVSVGGGLTYLGGSGGDELVHLPAPGNPLTVAGPVVVDFGDANAPVGDHLFQVADIEFQNSLTINSNNDTGADVVQVGQGDGSQTSITGAVLVDLAGGSNSADFVGTFDGVDFDYRGGAADDSVEYRLFGLPADVNMVLTDGVDNVIIGDGAEQVSIKQLRVDYGVNEVGDSFSLTTLGDFNTDATLLNYRGFDVFQSKALSQLNVVEKTALGDMTIGTDATGRAMFRHSLAGADALGRVDNLRLTSLSSSGDISIELNRPLDGYLIINARQGSRAISVPSGFDAFVGGTFRLDASAGNQVVNLDAVVTAGRTVFNLRGGDDMVVFNGLTNGIGSYFGELVFRGVNLVDHVTGAPVTVLGNLVFNSRFFTENAKFLGDVNFNVLGKFTYLGGDGQDVARLVFSSYGEVYVDLGDNVLGQQQSFFLRNYVSVGYVPNSTGRLIVKAGSSGDGNMVKTSNSSRVRGYSNVDLSASNIGANEVSFLGKFGDRLVYQGGSGSDNVTLTTSHTPWTSVSILTGAGQDTVNLKNSVSYLDLLIDFGDDVDQFFDEFMGVYPFPVTIQNLP